MSNFALTLTVALSMITGLSAPAHADEVVVFAAASLKNALDAVAAEFQQETGHTVTISYAGSNILAKQIIQGAPADIFISAAVNWMDEVQKAEEVVARADLLGNSLVLIAPSDTAKPVEIAKDFDLLALLGGEKLSMALVDSVPAGQYGKAALMSLGLWDKVQASVAQSDNVRAALTLVSRGEAPYGIVYGTDAASDKKVSVVGTFPADSHPAIIYPAALLKSAQDAADKAFYDNLSSDQADKIFRNNGFAILN